nr:MAG TPA: hypothetical protein [Caudoviricetes sp.]
MKPMWYLVASSFHVNLRYKIACCSDIRISHDYICVNNKIKKKTEEINLPSIYNATMHNRQFHKPVLPQVFHNNIHGISYGLHLVVFLVSVACVYVWFVLLI